MAIGDIVARAGDAVYIDDEFSSWNGSAWNTAPATGTMMQDIVMMERMANGYIDGDMETLDEWYCVSCGTMNPGDAMKCGTPFVGCGHSR